MNLFSAFRPKPAKAPTPTAEVLGFDGETLELQCQTVLSEGPVTVILLHGELELEKECAVVVGQGFPDKSLYWATLPPESELAEVLKPLIPKEAELAESGGELPPTWEEKRSRVRLQRVLGVMSPAVAGFKCLTFDVHREGLRLQLDKPLEVGVVIKLRFEIEDHRVPPFDVQAQVIWCQENPAKGYWAGIRFTQIKETEQEKIDKFVDETLAYENGVLTRDYVGD